MHYEIDTLLMRRSSRKRSFGSKSTAARGLISGREPGVVVTWALCARPAHGRRRRAAAHVPGAVGARSSAPGCLAGFRARRGRRVTRPDKGWRACRDRFRDQSASAARKLAADMNAGAARERRGREQASRDLEKWLAAGCAGPMPASHERARPSSRHFVERLDPNTRSGSGHQAQREAARSRKPTPVARRPARRPVAPARASAPTARSRPASIDPTAVYRAMRAAPHDCSSCGARREPPAHGMTALQIKSPTRARTFAELHAAAYGDRGGGAA